MSFDTLPTPLRVIERTRPLSVTSLGLVEQCLLRVALNGSEIRAPIPPSPLAELGTLIHRAIEEGATLATLWRWVKDPKRVVATLVIPEGKIPLIDALGRSVVRQRIARTALLPSKQGSGEVHRRRIAKEERLLGFDGGLSGRPDKLEIGPTSITIVDYKTGRLRDAAGDLREGYRLQLMGYGALLRAMGETRELVMNLVGADGTWCERFEVEDYDRVQRLVEHVERQIPLGKSVPADELATPGAVCLTCAYRPMCGQYLESAPQAWTEGGSDSNHYGGDIWGDVVEVSRAEGLPTVVVIDPADRRATIFDVPDHVLPDFDVSRPPKLFFFGVRSVPTGQGEYPRNFFVVGDRSHESAHAAKIYAQA